MSRNTGSSNGPIENVEFLQQQQQRTSSASARGSSERRHHRRNSSTRSRDSSQSATMIPLLQHPDPTTSYGGGAGGVYMGGGGYGATNAAPTPSNYGQFPPAAVQIPSASAYYGMPYSHYSPSSGGGVPTPPSTSTSGGGGGGGGVGGVGGGYQQQQQQQQQHPFNYNMMYQPYLVQQQQPQQQQLQQGGRGGGEVDATALSLDDIENAFHTAISSQYHPLKRDHPLTREPPPPDNSMAMGSTPIPYPQRLQQHQQQQHYSSAPPQQPAGGEGGGGGTTTDSGNIRSKSDAPGTAGYGSFGAAPNSRGVPPPPPAPRTSSVRSIGSGKKSHRRVSSDTPLRPLGHHRRSSSSDLGKMRLLQQQQKGSVKSAGSAGTDPLSRHRKRFISVDQQQQWLNNSTGRLMSSPITSLTKGGALNKPPTHRRTASFSSVGANSVATAGSMVSVVSDIRKSSLFEGYNEKGDIVLNFPTSNVHLVMDKTLKVGRVYRVPQSTQMYEEYHQIAEELDLGLADPTSTGLCGCDCPHCNACHGKESLLPTNYYVLSVPDDLYKRVLDDVCYSKTMPCGLFFCGHHEDVSRPNIVIPLIIVTLLFAFMGGVACWMET